MIGQDSAHLYERNAMSVSHPAESLLLEFLTGGRTRPSEIDEHLVSCSECMAVVRRLRHAGLGEPGAFDDLDILPSLPGPEAVRGALLTAVARAERRDVAPHQLWRAAPEGYDEMLLVWVRRLHSDGRPAVVPVSFDSEYAGDYDLIVPADRSPLEVELVFHTTAEGSIDRRTIIDCVADMNIAADIEAVRLARREGRLVEGLTVGTRIVSPHDERVEYRQHLTDLIVAMGTARFEPDRSSENEDHDHPPEPSLQDDILDALLDDPPLAALIREVRNGLAHSYPQAGRDTAQAVAQGEPQARLGGADQGQDNERRAP